MGTGAGKAGGATMGAGKISLSPALFVPLPEDVVEELDPNSTGVMVTVDSLSPESESAGEDISVVLSKLSPSEFKVAVISRVADSLLSRSPTSQVVSSYVP